MKSLKTLIDISNQELDRLRKEMNKLLDYQSDLESKKSDLQEKLKSEAEYTVVHPEAKAAYDLFAMNVQTKIQNIEYDMKQFDVLISQMQESISEAFSELKKYEILLDQKIAMELKEHNAKEQKASDEMSNVVYLRKQKESED